MTIRPDLDAAIAVRGLHSQGVPKVQPAARALVEVVIRGGGRRPIAVRGLAEIDTGGTLTFIAPSVARRLKLRRTGQRRVRGIGGDGQKVNRYAVEFELGGVQVPMFDSGVYDLSSLDTRTDSAIALIGRDVLAGGDGIHGLRIQYDGPNGQIRMYPSKRSAKWPGGIDALITEELCRNPTRS